MNEQAALARMARIEETTLHVADPALGDTSPSVHLELRHRNPGSILPQLWRLQAEHSAWTYSASCGLRDDHGADKDRALDEVLARLTCVIAGRVLGLCRELGLAPPYELRVSRGPVRFILPLPE